MLENFSLDLVNLLLFTMPGFFFLRWIGYKTESDLAYFMYSMFWGILLMGFVYKVILPMGKFDPLVENPYTGAIVFSLIAWLMGLLLHILKPKLPIEF